MQEDWSQDLSFRHQLGRCPFWGHMAPSQHSTGLKGGLLWHQGPGLGRAGVGGRTCVQNQKRAGLGKERLKVEYKGPGSDQCPGSGGQAPTWSPGMAGLKKPLLTQSGQSTCQGFQDASCGRGNISCPGFESDIPTQQPRLVPSWLLSGPTAQAPTLGL